VCQIESVELRSQGYESLFVHAFGHDHVMRLHRAGKFVGIEMGYFPNSNYCAG
jgi:hypothetical protein